MVLFVNETPGGRKTTVGLVQMSMAADPDANLRKALAMVDEAAEKGCQIICLPELFGSLYFCQEADPENFKLAESIPGRTSAALSDAARKNKVVIIAGIFEKKADGVYYNSAVTIDADGTLLGVYRKMHIPEDPAYFHEKFYFTPGDLGFRTYKTAYGAVGVLICWDQWYPEAARLTALMGAGILFYPTAIGWLPSERKSEKGEEILEAWETIQKSHGIANGVFIASANRVGEEGSIAFWGSSFISGPFGKVLARGSREREGLVIAQCDLSLIESTRQEWPFFRDRRIDAYKDIGSRSIG